MVIFARFNARFYYFNMHPSSDALILVAARLLSAAPMYCMEAALDWADHALSPCS
jgi:hypothetical protein